METGRVLFGLAASVLVPWERGWQRSQPWAMIAFSVVYGVYVIEPYRGQEKPWLVLTVIALVATSAVLMHSPSGMPSLGFSVMLPLTSGSVPVARRVGAGLLVVAIAVAWWTAGAKVEEAIAVFARSEKTAIFMSAGLVAVYGGGLIAKAVTAPIRRTVKNLPQGDTQRMLAEDFMMGSRNIGLLERGLMFAFLAAGQPDAAALALTAKSLARGPASDHGKYASEYFLLGTLASVIAALVMSVAARATVGLSIL